MIRSFRSTPAGLACIALLGGCMKHDPDVPADTGPKGTVHLTVKPMWGANAFDAANVYENISDHRVQVQLLKIYLGDLRFATASGTLALKDVDLVNLTNGPVERYYATDPDVYYALNFGVGVPYDLNHTDPALYPNEHPLSASNGMFWTWASLYRFLIFEGRYDTLPGTGPLPYQFSIHTGLDTCYREVELEQTMLVPDNDTLDLVLRVRLDKFFFNATDTFKLNETPQWHGEADQLEIGTRFSDLVKGAFTLE